MVIFKEITDKKKDYDAILQSEQRWRFALEGSKQGVWDWKLETNEVYFSSSWRKMLGYDKIPLINNMAEWEDLIHPDDKKRMAAQTTGSQKPAGKPLMTLFVTTFPNPFEMFQDLPPVGLTGSANLLAAWSGFNWQLIPTSALL